MASAGERFREIIDRELKKRRGESDKRDAGERFREIIDRELKKRTSSGGGGGSSSRTTTSTPAPTYSYSSDKLQRSFSSASARDKAEAQYDAQQKAIVQQRAQEQKEIALRKLTGQIKGNDKPTYNFRTGRYEDSSGQGVTPVSTIRLPKTTESPYSFGTKIDSGEKIDVGKIHLDPYYQTQVVDVIPGSEETMWKDVPVIETTFHAPSGWMAREDKWSSYLVNGTLDLAPELSKYEKYIEDGEFKGTKKQYENYLKAYDIYKEREAEYKKDYEDPLRGTWEKSKSLAF